MIVFERYQSGVMATVHLDYGVVLRFVSEDTVGERRWEVDEIQFEPDPHLVHWTVQTRFGGPKLWTEAELHTTLDREFTAWCRQETQESHDGAPA